MSDPNSSLGEDRIQLFERTKDTWILIDWPSSSWGQKCPKRVHWNCYVPLVSRGHALPRSWTQFCSQSGSAVSALFLIQHRIIMQWFGQDPFLMTGLSWKSILCLMTSSVKEVDSWNWWEPSIRFPEESQKKVFKDQIRRRSSNSLDWAMMDLPIPGHLRTCFDFLRQRIRKQYFSMFDLNLPFNL